MNSVVAASGDYRVTPGTDPNRSPDRPGLIYVAEIDIDRNGARGWKIGHAINLPRRVYEHARWESKGFVLVAVGVGTRRQENAIHCALHGVPVGRMPGERYRDSEELRSWLANDFRAFWRGRVVCSVPEGRARRLPWRAAVCDIADHTAAPRVAP